MATAYDAAVATLFQAPLDQFVAERKRLAAELKAGGDKTGAQSFAKLARPPIAAWVVNQLWWQSREGFDQLFATAERLRSGELAAGSVHRDALAKLRASAAELLSLRGHPVTEATLRRVATTLSALAAGGGFAPDPPGALVADRDPPGFDAAGSMSFPVRTTANPVAEKTEATPYVANDTRVSVDRAQAVVERAQAQEAAEAKRRRDAQEATRVAEERKRAEERQRAERAERLAEKKRLDEELQTTRARLAAQQRERDRLQTELTKSKVEMERTQTKLNELEASAAQLASKL